MRKLITISSAEGTLHALPVELLSSILSCILTCSNNSLPLFLCPRKFSQEITNSSYIESRKENEQLD